MDPLQPLPLNAKIHSTKAELESSACFRSLPTTEIWKAEKWSNPLIFVKHYALDRAARSDTNFRRVVLQSLFDGDADMLHFQLSGMMMLACTYSGIHIDTFEEERVVIYPHSSCGSSRCSSQCEFNYLPSIPAFGALS